MAAFTPGNLVIYRVGVVGSGTALTSSATAVFLDEYTPAGVLVQSIAMPTADSGSNQILTANGSSTAEGMLDLSSDGRYLILTGYDAPIGTATSITSSATINRVIGRVDANGLIDTTTVLNNAFSGTTSTPANIRGATSTDGSVFWVTGSNTGVVTTSYGGTSGTIVSTTGTNLRAIDIFGDQLYVSTGSGSTFRIGAVGTGTPVTTGQTITNIAGGPTTGSPFQFVFVDLSAGVPGLDTLYYADDGSISGIAAGIYKYTLSGGTWVADGMVAAASVRGLTASVSGSTVSLFATSASTLFRFTDTTGYDGTITGSATTLTTASTNTAFRGIEFTPGQVVEFSPVALTQAEGDSGATLFTFTVTRTGGTIGVLDFSGTVAAGTTNGADYTGGVAPTTFSGSIPAGQTSGTVTVSVAGDKVVEANEAFTLTLTSVSNSDATIRAGIGSNATATGNIIDDDTPVLTIADVTQAEGNAGTSVFTFTISLDRPAPFGGVTFDIATADDSATTAGGDYVARTLLTQTIDEGATSYTFDVTVNGDSVFEADEAFLVNVTNVVRATVGDGQATGTIQNDDAAPVGTFSIDDVTHDEGNSGTTLYTFTVTRSGGSAGAATVDYQVVATGIPGVAAIGDFAADEVFSGTLSFADGETSKPITVKVQGDTDVETTETFTVTLSNATGGASIGDDSGTGTITNDDALPPAGSVSIADAQIVEGNAGTSTLVLTLTRTGGFAAFTVDFATSNGGNPNNASATAGSDYVAQAGTVSFGAGEDVKTISITINGDTAFELSEEFKVTLANATAGATISDSVAIATITNDDSAPATVRLLGTDFTGFAAGGFAPEPAAGQIDSDIWRVVGLSDIANPPFGFTATTGDFARGVIAGSADPMTAGVYSASGGAALILQPTGAELDSGGFIEARIQNTSGSTATALAIAFDWVYRNSGDRASNLQFSYSTDGTNFTAVPDAGFVTPATKEASVPSTFSSSNETLNLTGLSIPDQGYVYLRWTHLSSSGANNRDEFGIDNVTVDASVSGPPALAISVSDVSVNEAAGTMTFTVTRDSLTGGAFTVDYATADGTAIAGQDYAATGGTLSFTDNQVRATVTVPIVEDSVAEFDDTVLLNLSNPTGGAVIRDAQGVGTILNDDGAPIAVSIGDVAVTEGQSGTTIATFTVTRTGGTGAFTIDYATSDQTAQAGSDYVATSNTLSFAENENSKTFTVTINGDTATEDNETFRVTLSNPTGNALIADGIGIGTILTDDPTYIHSIQGTSYYSPILAAEGKTAFNVASTTIVIIKAVVTAVDSNGPRQGFYVTEELADWDDNPFTSEGIFVMTRNDSSVGSLVTTAAPNIQVGDIVTFSAQVMEYQFSQNQPRTVLVNMTGFSREGTSALPVLTLDASRPIPNSIMTGVTPNYTDWFDDSGDSFDASLYALSFWETVEGMLVTLPDVVVADGFIDTSGGQPFFQAYSRVHADADQINSRGGYTIAGDPPSSPPDTADPEDNTIAGGRHLHDGDINPDIIEIDFTGFATPAPDGLTQQLSMGDGLGDVTGIVEFDFTDRKLFVTSWDSSQFVNTQPTRETTALAGDPRSLRVATFNVENLDPTDGQARFDALAGVIATNLKAPDIIIVEEMQDNNGGRENSEPTTKGAGDGTSPTGTDASLSWQMLVDALNAAVPGARYQWVDQPPVYNAEGGQNNGNIRVGFIYNTARVQLGDLPADATIEERRQFTDRIGDGVGDAGDRIQFSDDLIAGQINAADWASTRLPLLGQFTFSGNTVFVVGNHFTAKGGSGNFWQLNQDLAAGQPENSGWAKRNQQALDVYAMLDYIQSNSPKAGIIAGGDFNDFYFYRPLEVLTGYVLPDGTARTGGSRFDNLVLTLPEAERYTYTFDGRSQALDHIVANSMLSAVATYDVVHVNTGFNALGTGADTSQRLSDHDPALASFDFRTLSEVLVGTSGRDVFRMEQGGDDRVSGLGGNDTFYFGGAFTSADFVDGGDGVDSIILDGDYSFGLVLGTGTTSNIVGIETISLVSASDTAFDGSAAGSYSYDITTLDSNVAAGALLKFNGFYLTATENFTFDGSAERDGKFIILAGLGTDNLTGGWGNDVFVFGHDGRFGATDIVRGGPGYDVVYLRGDYSLNFKASGAGTIMEVESIFLASATDNQYTAGGDGEFDYVIVWNDAMLANDALITVNGSALGENESMSFDGRDEVGGRFRLFGGAADDVIRGGGGTDLIYGGRGADTLSGGGGNDLFVYYSTSESTPTGRDGIQDFTLGDLIDLSVIDADVDTPGNQAFTFIGTGVFTGAGQLRVIGGGPIYTVQGDTNGDGIVDFELTVTVADLHPLTASDFIL